MTAGMPKRDFGHNEGIEPAKIPWKKVAEHVAQNGTYRFGNATCRKKWDEMYGIPGRYLYVSLADRLNQLVESKDSPLKTMSRHPIGIWLMVRDNTLDQLNDTIL